MLYIFDENLVFGVDLNIIELLGIKKEKVITKITNISNSILLGNEIFNKCRDFMKELNNGEKLIPYIYRNGEYDKNNDLSVVC